MIIAPSTIARGPNGFYIPQSHAEFTVCGHEFIVEYYGHQHHVSEEGQNPGREFMLEAHAGSTVVSVTVLFNEYSDDTDPAEWCYDVSIRTGADGDGALLQALASVACAQYLETLPDAAPYVRTTEVTTVKG